MRFAIDAGVVTNRRSVRHDVKALDQDVRRGERDARCTNRIDGEESDVRTFVGNGFHRFCSRIENDQCYVRA